MCSGSTSTTAEPVSAGQQNCLKPRSKRGVNNAAAEETHSSINESLRHPAIIVGKSSPTVDAKLTKTLKEKQQFSLMRSFLCPQKVKPLLVQPLKHQKTQPHPKRCHLAAEKSQSKMFGPVDSPFMEMNFTPTLALGQAASINDNQTIRRRARWDSILDPTFHFNWDSVHSKFKMYTTKYLILSSKY